MKKWLAVLLCAVMVLGLLPVIAAADTITTVMYVVNCNDWVSLREKAETSSKRLLKVHLGEYVFECTDGGNGFVRCEFGGKTGYIQSKYLKKTNLTGNEGFLKNQMVVKVDEWVSLREETSTSSKRLAKVPLGSVVTQCLTANNGFVYCCYKGTYGYISAQYLADADWDWLDNKDKTYDDVPDIMEVYNCNDWVSLRRLPSAKSDRMEKVPLGALVTDCRQVSDKFISCAYNGKSGYIQKDYLKAYTGYGKADPVTDEDDPGTEEYDPRTEEDFPAAEDVNPFLKYETAVPDWKELTLTGMPVLDVTVGDCKVIARRVETANAEWLYAACYDAEMQPMWGTMTSRDQLTELTGTDAFIAGTEEGHILVIFTSGEGFRAYALVPQKTEVWNCDAPEVQEVSGCICYGVDEDGTIYVCGFYDNAPVCISNWGDYIWTGVNDDPDVYWPYEIDVNEEGIEVLYDCNREDESLCYRIDYSRDGSVIFSGMTEKPDYTAPAGEEG